MPAQSDIAPRFAGAHLADAFAITLAPSAPQDIETLTRAVLGNPAPWFRAMLALRDALVGPFGVKTSAQLRAALHASDRTYVDFFPVVSQRPAEWIVGDDDKHLDFRASVLVCAAGSAGAREVVFTTVVHCHNLFGRAYLFVIGPFHRLVVRSSLARAAASGWRAAPEY